MCLEDFLLFFSLSPFLRKKSVEKKKKKKKKKKNIEDDRLSLRFVFFRREGEKSTRVLGPSRPALRDVVDVDVVVSRLGEASGFFPAVRSDRLGRCRQRFLFPGWESAVARRSRANHETDARARTLVDARGWDFGALEEREYEVFRSTNIRFGD